MGRFVTGGGPSAITLLAKSATPIAPRLFERACFCDGRGAGGGVSELTNHPPYIRNLSCAQEKVFPLTPSCRPKDCPFFSSCYVHHGFLDRSFCCGFERWRRGLRWKYRLTFLRLLTMADEFVTSPNNRPIQNNVELTTDTRSQRPIKYRIDPIVVMRMGSRGMGQLPRLMNS